MNNLDFWESMQLWGTRFAAFGAIAAGLYGLLKAIVTAVKKIMSISNKIQNINEQLTSNGGSSLLDAIYRIETRQVRNEQRERAFLQQHDTAMFELDEKLNLKWANTRFLKLVDLDSDDVANKGWHNCICENDRNRVVDLFEDSCNMTRNIQTTCNLIIDCNKTKNYNLNATVMRDIKNQTSGFFVCVIETTEMVNYEEIS